MLTVDTITDEQIRELRDVLQRDSAAWHHCNDALIPPCALRSTARAYCAALLNDRAKAAKSKEAK